MTSSGKLEASDFKPDSGHKSLPESYGSTEAALLPRDPNWMFIYWEITDDSKARISREHGGDVFEKARSVIRVFEVAAGKYFDVPVRLDARNWYINVQEGGKTYYCEIGLALPDGRFISMVKTNSIKLPSGRVSEVMDEKWMSVSADFEKLLQISGVEYVGKGSGEVAKTLAQRWEMLRAVFTRAASWGVSSLSSHALSRPESEKKFWLVADCELILYGATEPDASVTVADRKVALNPDGTFSMRFALPEGALGLPIKAVSKDENDSRKIKIEVTRANNNDGK